MIVTGRSGSTTQEVLIFVHTLDKRSQEQQEPGILPGGLSGAEQIFSGIGSQGPVVVLTGAVYAGKGLFVEKTDQIVLGGTLFHDLHDQLVGIAGTVGGGVNGRHFVLARSSFIVFGLGQNTKPPKLFVQVLHVVGNSGTDGAKVMIFQFLTLGCKGAEECSAG